MSPEEMIRKPIDIRRRIVVELFDIGLTIRNIAEALKIETCSVVFDIKSIRGKKEPTISKNLGTTNRLDRVELLYSIALQRYAELVNQPPYSIQDREVHKGVVDALASYLDIKYLDGVAQGIWSSIKPKIFPNDPEEYKGYRHLLTVIFRRDRIGIFIPLNQDKENGSQTLFNFYLKYICKEKNAPKRSEFSDSFANWIEEESLQNICVPLTENSIRIIDAALKTIFPREEKVICMTFGIRSKKITLEECGDEIGRTKERARQIQATAIRKLRHPNRRRDLIQLVSHPNILANEFLKGIAKRDTAEEEKLKEVIFANLPIGKEGKTLDEILNTSIEELDVSVRTYNFFKRTNIKIIRDLVRRSEAECLRIKHFGRKSLNELRELLMNMGGLYFGMKFDNKGNLITPLLKTNTLQPE